MKWRERGVPWVGKRERALAEWRRHSPGIYTVSGGEFQRGDGSDEIKIKLSGFISSMSGFGVVTSSIKGHQPHVGGG